MTDTYENLGGLYFPILQQDGTREMVRIATHPNKSQLLFLGWLRKHDREHGAGK